MCWLNFTRIAYEALHLHLLWHLPPVVERIVSHRAAAGQSYFLTTNRDFVHQGEAQKEAEPNLFVQDRSHLRVAHVHKAIWEEGKRHPDAPGRGGARGEISRHAGESGAKLGAEVFADVYARNFTLQGGRK